MNRRATIRLTMMDGCSANDTNAVYCHEAGLHYHSTHYYGTHYHHPDLKQYSSIVHNHGILMDT
jgi:hypothetical protein